MCSKKLDPKPKELLNVWARAFVSDPLKLRESDRVLNREVCSPKLAVEPKEPIIDRKREDLSANPVVKPKVALRDLSNEVCSANVEIKPKELLGDLKREVCSTKLVPEPNEPVIDLNKEECSTKLEPKFIELDKLLNSPLVSKPVGLKEPDRDRKSDEVFPRVEEPTSEQLTSFARPLV